MSYYYGFYSPCNWCFWMRKCNVAKCNDLALCNVRPFIFLCVVTELTAVPKGIVWKALNDATGLVKLDLVTIDDHFNHAVMQMLTTCLAHHLFLSWQLIFALTDTLKGCSQPTSSFYCSWLVLSLNKKLQSVMCVSAKHTDFLWGNWQKYVTGRGQTNVIFIFFFSAAAGWPVRESGWPIAARGKSSTASTANMSVSPAKALE